MADDKQKLYGGRKKTAGAENAKQPRRGLFYNSWLEGYTTHVELGPDNKKRTVSVYEGAYYVPEASPKKRILLKAAYAALLALSVCLFLLAATAEIQGNYQKLLALPQAADVVAMLWLLRKLISYCAAGKRLTEGEYKNISKAVIRTALAAAVCFAATAAAALAQLFWSVPGERGKTVLCAALYVCGGLCMLAVHRMEKGLKYTVCPSQNEEASTSSL